MKANQTQRLELYKQGLSDHQIAVQLGMSQEGISFWRRQQAAGAAGKR